MVSRPLEQTQPISAAMEASRRERLLLALAAAFVGMGAAMLHLAYQPFTLAHLAITCAVFLFAFATSHLTISRHLPNRDPLLLPAGALLSGWGLLLVGRLAPNFLARQTTWLMLGTLAMLFVAQVGEELRWLQRYRYTWLVGGLLLLAATLLLGVNPSGSGPRLWLGLGGAYFQPSEPLKLLMVVFLASYLAERRKLIVSAGRKVGPVRLPPPAYVGPLVAMFGLAVLLLAAQQDLGAAMLFFLTFLVMLYLATAQWGYVVAGLVLFAGAGVVGSMLSTRLGLRFSAWLDPWSGAADWSFQVVQSLLAFGTGGVLGEGLGMGRPTYIPAVHTDFTFAAIGESFGLIGLLAVIALYALLLLRGFRVAERARRVFHRYLAAGLTAGLIIQAWVIMAANVKLGPIAGVTLPFLSYGGSSLLSTFIVLGLLIRMSHRVSEEAAGAANPVYRGSIDRTARRAIFRTAGTLTLGLVAVAAVSGYWSVARSDWLVAREDNPRRVLYEQRIVRGRILDRHGDTLAGVVVGPSGLVTRTYSVSQAAPVVGYASLRYGTGGIESAFDEALRGEAGRSVWQAKWAELLHRSPKGGDVQITLDARLQIEAQEALTGEAGAAVLLEAASGQVLAMASAPSFDPVGLGEAWDELREDPSAPLLNRATQGLYQPGAALQTVVVGEALARGLIEDLEVAAGPDPRAPVSVNGVRVGCTAPSEADLTLASSYAAACPAPIRALGERLGMDGLAGAVERWRLTISPPLSIPTEAAGWSPEVASSPGHEAIGQGALTVSPLHMALVAGTVANRGVMPDPRLTLNVEQVGGNWQEADVGGQRHRVLSPAEAETVLSAWRPCGEQVRGHWGVAVAGEGAPHAWFLGAAPGDVHGGYALAVLVEHADEPRRAIEIGCRLLKSALRSAES